MTVGTLDRFATGEQVLGLRVVGAARRESLGRAHVPFVSGIPVSVILGEPRSQRSESQSVDSGCDEALRGVAAGQRWARAAFGVSERLIPVWCPEEDTPIRGQHGGRSQRGRPLKWRSQKPIRASQEMWSRCRVIR